MNIQLRYFTGTGNSLKVSNTIKGRFSEEGNIVQLSKISIGEPIPQCDLVGFCFPVYAFGIPRIARQYLRKMAEFKNRQKAFIIITAGDQDESGFSINETVKFLLRKKCEIVYSSVIQMPINWVTAMDPPGKEEAQSIISSGVSQAIIVANDIMNDVSRYHKFNVPKRYSRVGLWREYFLFRYLGIKNLWRTFRTYDSCNGCQLCARACPTKSIVIKNKLPVWLNTCEQCMRCVNMCPNESIYQKYSGSTKTRNKYLEPSFRPLHD